MLVVADGQALLTLLLEAEGAVVLVEQEGQAPQLRMWKVGYRAFRAGLQETLLADRAEEVMIQQTTLLLEMRSMAAEAVAVHSINRLMVGMEARPSLALLVEVEVGEQIMFLRPAMAATAALMTHIRSVAVALEAPVEAQTLELRALTPRLAVVQAAAAAARF